MDESRVRDPFAGPVEAPEERSPGHHAVMAVGVGALRETVPANLVATGLLVLLGAIIYVGVLIGISPFVRQKLFGILPSLSAGQ